MQAVLGALLFPSLAASAVPVEAGKKKDKKAEEFLLSARWTSALRVSPD